MAALAALLAAAPAQAKKIQVKPGKGTLQRAVDRAAPGDKLELKGDGAYKGGVVIEKRLTIRGPREGPRPIVDGRCREAFTVLVLDGNVSLTRLRVTGATDEAGSQYGGAEVNFIEGGHGAATDLRLAESCTGTQYGINVFDSEDVSTTGNVITGYLDAAIYVGGIRNPQTEIEVRGNVARDGNHGILIEDSLPEPEITITDNAALENDKGSTSAGIYIRNSDGVLIEQNSSQSNGTSGVWLDQNSDLNALVRNAASANGVADLQNDGDGNCGADNSFATAAGNPLDACAVPN